MAIFGGQASVFSVDYHTDIQDYSEISDSEAKVAYLHSSIEKNACRRLLPAALFKVAHEYAQSEYL